MYILVPSDQPKRQVDILESYRIERACYLQFLCILRNLRVSRVIFSLKFCISSIIVFHVEKRRLLFSRTYYDILLSYFYYSGYGSLSYTPAVTSFDKYTSPWASLQYHMVLASFFCILQACGINC